jgi:hypothetical protein
MRDFLFLKNKPECYYSLYISVYELQRKTTFGKDKEENQ